MQSTSACNTAACDLLRRSCPSFLHNCRSLPSFMPAQSHISHASQVVNASDWERRNGGSSLSNTGTGTRITLAFFRLCPALDDQPPFQSNRSFSLQCLQYFLPQQRLLP